MVNVLNRRIGDKQGVILLTQNSLAGAVPLDPLPGAIAGAKGEQGGVR